MKLYDQIFSSKQTVFQNRAVITKKQSKLEMKLLKIDL